jgi:hypothetical protein
MVDTLEMERQKSQHRDLAIDAARRRAHDDGRAELVRPRPSSPVCSRRSNERLSAYTAVARIRALNFCEVVGFSEPNLASG